MWPLQDRLVSCMLIWDGGMAKRDNSSRAFRFEACCGASFLVLHLFMSQNGVNDGIVSLLCLTLDEFTADRSRLVSVTNQPSQEESSFDDSSGSLFSMYSKAAEKVDIKMSSAGKQGY